MKCADKGMLQTYIDGELDIGMKKELESHLVGCEKCSALYQELKGNDDFAFGKIQHYHAHYSESAGVDAKPLKNVPSDGRNRNKTTFSLLKYRKFIAAACLVFVATTCLYVQPIRAAISNALSIFRVENVKGIHISLEDIENIRTELQKKNPQISMEQYGKIGIVGGEEKPATLEALKSDPDIHILMPLSFPGSEPKLSITTPMSINFALNVKNVNNLLKTFKSAALLPEEADGKTFSAKFSKVVIASYTVGNNQYSIEATKSPELLAPENVDVDALYKSMVELPLLPENLKQKLRGIKDWKNTLYLPIVDSISKEVQINGNKGVLYRNDSKGETRSILLWYNEGNIYCIQSNTNEDDILQVAESMR